MDQSSKETSLENMMMTRLYQISGRIKDISAEAEIYCRERDYDEVVVRKAQICASRLHNMINRFTMDLAEYFRLSSSPSPDDISAMSGSQINAEEVLAELKCRLDESLNKKIINAKGQEKNCSAKLPTLTLPHYDGDILNWTEFWDIYKSNIHDRPIPDVDKLLYLKSILQGEPRRIIDGLETTNTNYAVAVEILHSRYGKQSRIIDAHYSALSKVKPAVSSIAECRVTVNEIERHLRVLKSLGENSNHNHLRYLIMEKFPADIIYEMKTKLKEDTVDQMREQLELIISAREEANRVKQERNPTGKESFTVETLHTVQHNREPIRNRPERGNDNKSHREKYMKRNNVRKEISKRGNGLRSDLKNHEVSRKRSFEQRFSDQRGKVKARRLFCIFCKGNHFADQCKKYGTLKERKTQLKNHCFNCFSRGHFVSSCKDPNRKCVYCQGRHHRALCPRKCQTKKEATLTTINDSGCTILQTAVVLVKNKDNNCTPVKCRILLDSGSQRSYVTERVSRDLNLSVVEENKLSIFGFASERPQEYNSRRVKLEILTRINKTIIIYANEVPFITKGVQPPEIDLRKWENMTLADDGSLKERVDILIGNDYYFDLISTEKVRLKNNLYLINSNFGWIMSGKVNTDDNKNSLSIITYCQDHDPNCVYYTDPDLPLKNLDISFLWALESIGITDNPKATREEEAIKHLNETIQYVNGRYMVKWPWIHYPPELPTNFGLAYGRLKALLQRLDDNSRKEYNNILQEQMENGVIEVVDPGENMYVQRIPPIHYLPHHMVKQDNKKGRIVYDASGKLKDSKSLNECLYRGPSMIEDLVALLIQFRTHRVAITADVEKAFLQIGLQTEDRDVTRFIWIKDPQKPMSMDNIIHMRFCRVPFGIISSPFILSATLRYHVSQNAPELICRVIDKFYVDNFITGADSTGEAIDLYETSRKVFNEIAMNLRDWVSNDESFLDRIPPEYKIKDTAETRTLGLLWNVKEDKLRLNIKEELFTEENVRKPQSKRKILSTIASLYDPCGYSSPLILPAKLLLQQLWEMKIKWDSDISEELQEKWVQIVQQLRSIKDIELPRYMLSIGPLEKSVFELHAFSDASKYAYATVVYLTTEYEGNRNTAFIMAKSKVTPKEERKLLRIPRLELLGCYLGSKLLSYVKNIIGIPIKREYLWTDSQIVLSWINSNKLLPPFIGRRVNAIRENKQLEIRYINSERNPADLATRPEQWQKKRSLWFDGPKFLSESKRKWPSHFTSKIPETTLQNQDPSGTINLMEVDDPLLDQTLQEQRISEVNNTIKRIKDLQKQYFPLESEGKKTSLAINLDIFTDIDGLIRCNGRMKNANWPFDKRHPILIPKDCEFTNELVMKTHKDCYHMGANQTLSKIRETYWIPRGKSYIQGVLKKCPECTKHNGGPFKLPPASALPPERVNYTAPFSYTGVDYMGPVLINNGNDTSKRWICLFTCLVVRAVHMEVVQDLTAEEGLLALRRMISTRGVPTLVISDNAQHFKLIAEVISNKYCVEKKIRWRFINPLSPWTGGFYERLIGIVKNCMKKTLDKHMLGDNQLATVVKEIEAVINSRPLTYVDSELDYILKPSDFLTVGRVITLEESENIFEAPTTSATKTGLIKGWKRALTILKEFKDMFVNRYLLSLRERYGHLPREPRITSKLSPTPGQIVQIKGDSKNRIDWKVGKITTLIPSADGLVRAAKVQVGKNEYIRSISHLYPLEVEDTQNAIFDSTNSEENTLPSPTLQYNTGNREEQVEICPSIPDPVSCSVPQPISILPMERAEDEINIQTEGKRNQPEKTTNDPLPATALMDDKDTNQRSRRAAATKAIEKIKEWTRELSAFLLLSRASPPGSVAASASL